MNVVSSHVNSSQKPLSNFTGIADRKFNRFALLRIKGDNSAGELAEAVLMPCPIRRKSRRHILIMETVNRAAFISVKPGAVRPKGNQICERNIGVVPHRKVLLGRAKAARLRRRF